jgi:hypothetical protein
VYHTAEPKSFLSIHKVLKYYGYINKEFPNFDDPDKTDEFERMMQM